MVSSEKKPASRGTPSSASGGTSRRWHDLDALRAFAMLLGIGLHAALSFTPTQWPVQDVRASVDGPFDEIVLAIHGFRMPLFFLLSGFFTALLWRRRGLPALLGHRMRRVVVPLILGLVLIVPTVDWVSEHAIEAQIADERDIHAAAYLGKLDAARALLDAGADVDAVADEGGYTPLYLAAVTGHADMARLLIDAGADPGIASPNGLAVDAAAWFAHEEVADLLVSAGARDPRAPGQAWEDLAFWAGGVGTSDDASAVGALESWLPSLHHLWFLWFLILFIVAFAPLAWMADRWSGRRDRWSGRRDPGSPSPRWTRWLMWGLVPLVVVPQLAMTGGATIAAFGPDTSIGWVPLPHVLAYYALFFAFGALLYDRVGRAGASIVETVGGRWWVVLPVALLVFVAGFWATFEGGAQLRLVASSLQVAYAWLMIFGLMGLFRAVLSAERPWVRYLSDSSYWMYLTHVTLVIALQAWVRTWDIPATVKALLIVATTSVVLLLTYQAFVRYSPIGTMLNGKRVRSPPRPAPSTPRVGVRPRDPWLGA